MLQEAEVRELAQTHLDNDQLPLKNEWDRLVANRDYGVGRRTRYVIDLETSKCMSPTL